jgi:hypothetical protein
MLLNRCPQRFSALKVVGMVMRIGQCEEIEGYRRGGSSSNLINFFELE